MLTLRTLKELIDTPERGEKLPTPKQLRTGESPVVAHIFDCGRGYGETKSPSSCKAEKIPEGFLSDIAKLALRENTFP